MWFNCVFVGTCWKFHKLCGFHSLVDSLGWYCPLQMLWVLNESSIYFLKHHFNLGCWVVVGFFFKHHTYCFWLFSWIFQYSNKRQCKLYVWILQVFLNAFLNTKEMLYIYQVFIYVRFSFAFWPYPWNHRSLTDFKRTK